jgi:YHS domain-containing protein
MTRDPVCDADVDEAVATAQGLVREYDGRIFHFCNAQCMSEFDREPDSYTVHMIELDRLSDEGPQPSPGST